MKLDELNTKTYGLDVPPFLNYPYQAKESELILSCSFEMSERVLHDLATRSGVQDHYFAALVSSVILSRLLASDPTHSKVLATPQVRLSSSNSPALVWLSPLDRRIWIPES